MVGILSQYVFYTSQYLLLYYILLNYELVKR